MRFNRLQAKTFGALREADIDLRGLRVAVFVGTNGAGKTTVADAASFALTNAARGKAGGSVRDLTTWGEKGMKVTATVQRDDAAPEFAVGRTPSGADASQETLAERLGLRSIDALSCSFDAMKFLGWDVAKRKAFMLRVGGVALDAAALAAAGIDDQEIVDLALKRGVKAAETAAAERKRAANRDADEARRPEPADVEVAVGGGTVRVSSLSLVELTGGLADARRKRDEAQRALAAAERAVAELARFDERRKAAEAAVTTARADLAAAESRIAKAAAARKSSRRLRDEAETLIPATREGPPTAPAAPAKAPAPSTEAGAAARTALERATSTAEHAEWRVGQADAEVTRTARDVELAERGAWPEVEKLCQDLEGYGFECTAGPLRLSTPFMRIRTLAKANGPDLAALRTRLDQARAAHAKAVAERDAAQAAVKTAQAAFDAAAAAYRTAKADADAEDARRAQAHAAEVEVWQKRLAERNARVKAAEDQRRELLGQAAAAERLEEADARELRDAQGSLRAAESHLAGVVASGSAAGGDPAAIAKTITELDETIATTERVAALASGYAASRTAWAAAKAIVDAKEKAAARYERMEKALRPDGAVGRLAAGPLAVVQGILAKIDPGVVLTNEYEVLIDNHEQGAANTARLWLAGAYLSIALSAAAGTRFVVLDGLGVVVEPTEVNRLLDALVTVEQFDQAFVTLSRRAAEPVRASPNPRVGTFRVADGVVTRVTAAPAATAAA
mgnify:CR=1 FL=1